MKKVLLAAIIIFVAAAGLFAYLAYSPHTPSAELKAVNNTKFGVTFNVPGNWNSEDHTKDTGEFWYVEPKSRGDGVDGDSFRLVISTTSTSFPKLVSFDIGNDFDAMQARRPGTTENGTTGESFAKLADMTVSGYPAIHFQIVGAKSKDGIRDMEDGLWIRTNDRNLLFYFTSVDSAKQYTFYTEASEMKKIFDSVHITP